MIDIFVKIFPVFFIISTGLFLKRTIIRNTSFWETSDKLVYYILFPALLVLKLSHANFKNVEFFYGLVAVAIATLLVAMALLFSKYLFNLNNREFTSFFQGGTRYNSYIFIAMSLSIFGDNGLVIASIFIAYMIILTNIISVVILSIYGEGNSTVKNILLSIVKNPLIISASIGVLISISEIKMPYTLEEYLKYIGNAALPLSLLSIGAGLVFFFSFKKTLMILSSVLVKLVVLPLITIFLLKLFLVSGNLFGIAMLYASVPCAGNAYILAKQMGGDAESMAAIITLTTIVATISIPSVIYLSGI